MSKKKANPIPQMKPFVTSDTDKGFRLECLKLAQSAGTISEIQPAEQVIERAKAYAAFILDTSPSEGYPKASAPSDQAAS